MKATKDIDLLALMDANLVATHENRGDEASAHISDLGKCLYSVWGRRNGKPQIKPSAATIARFRTGHLFEAWLVDEIGPQMDALGFTLKQDQLVELSYGDEDAIGHLDLLFIHRDTNEHRIVECKSTTFFEQWVETGESWEDTGKPKKERRRIPDKEPQSHHLSQTSGYAIAKARELRVPSVKFAIVSICRASLQRVQFPKRGEWYESADFEERVDREAAALKATEPSVDPIAAGIAKLNAKGAVVGIPPEETTKKNGLSWWCRYCDNAICPLNQNEDAHVIA